MGDGVHLLHLVSTWIEGLCVKFRRCLGLDRTCSI